MIINSFTFPSILRSKPDEEVLSIVLTPMRIDYLGHLSVRNYPCFMAGGCGFYLAFVFLNNLIPEGDFIIADGC